VFNYVIRMRGMPPSTNPFLGLGATRSRGRRDLPPPTLRELERIHAACGALGDYGPQLRDLLDFAALTIMRPSELFELRYGDVDLAHNRIAVDRRLYRGRIDTPKSGQKRIGLAPMARIILLRQPTRTRADGLVFVGKTGTRLNNSLLSLYWANVRAAAGLDRTFDFYRCSKHWGVHRLYLEGLSARAIAQQAGWSEKHVEKLLDVYAHRDLATLAEFDALYAESVDTDPGVTHEPRKARP
jgi:integrase